MEEKASAGRDSGRRQGLEGTAALNTAGLKERDHRTTFSSLV